MKLILFFSALVSITSALATESYSKYRQTILINGVEQPAYTIYHYALSPDPTKGTFLYKFEYPVVGFAYESKTVFDFGKFTSNELENLYIRNCGLLPFPGGVLEEVVTPAGTFQACKIVHVNEKSKLVEWKAGVRPAGTVKEHLFMSDGTEAIIELQSFEP